MLAEIQRTIVRALGLVARLDFFAQEHAPAGTHDALELRQHGPRVVVDHVLEHREGHGEVH